jgi:phosphatidylserine/phosphatidylglycerophosphate/cardiolipin synthase-like enzyme
MLWYENERVAGELLWTLPSKLAVKGVDTAGYLTAATEVVRTSQSRLLVVSPYLETEGVGRLQHELLEALQRGVAVKFVTHGAEVLGSWASTSLEDLRREAVELEGRLFVFCVPQATDVLIHSKVVVADGECGVLGSANLTGRGFGRNLETGVTIGAKAAAEIERVLAQAVECGLLVEVYKT